MREPFIEAAVARGLPRRVVVINHVVPNSLLPVITLIGYNAAALVAGAVVIETVFALPGVGSRLVSAVSTRDFPVILGIAVLTGVVVVLVNIVTDLLYALDRSTCSAVVAAPCRSGSPRPGRSVP